MLHRLPGTFAAATLALTLVIPTRAMASIQDETSSSGPLTVVTEAFSGDLDRLLNLVRLHRERQAEAELTEVFAHVDGLPLRLPNDEVFTIAYHEAHAGNLVIDPLGAPLHNHNRGRLRTPPTGNGDHDYYVLWTRERTGHAMSAVDLVQPAGADVLALVTGTVIDVQSYLLYGEHPDLKMTIRPDARPDLLLVLHHLDGVLVSPGDHVEAGRTVLAETARTLDLLADAEAYGRGPHVDVRVRRW